jgi:hypothetical protein
MHTWSLTALCNCFTVFLSSITSDMAVLEILQAAIDGMNDYDAFLNSFCTDCGHTPSELGMCWAKC